MRMLLGLATVVVLTATLHAQKPQKTPWGDPDLQGTWNSATVTPIERPAALGDKAFFTEQEAAEFNRTGLERLLKSVAPEVAFSGELNETYLEPGKVVRSRRTSLVTDPENGKIPYTPEGQKRWDDTPAPGKRIPADAPEQRALSERCLPINAFLLPNPFYDNNQQIVQAPGYVVFASEMMHEARIIPLDGRPHLKSTLTTWNGDSRGHWEGQTLVIETTNFNDEQRFRGTTSSLRIVERLTRVDNDTIDYELTVSDPQTFTRPWTLVNTLRSQNGRIYEYACNEHNYGLQGILRGARVQEQGR